MRIDIAYLTYSFITLHCRRRIGDLNVDFIIFDSEKRYFAKMVKIKWKSEATLCYMMTLTTQSP